jgi:hypothetical protein
VSWTACASWKAYYPFGSTSDMPHFCSAQLQYNLLSQKFTITKIKIALPLKMAANCKFFCILNVSGTIADHVSFSQHKYFCSAGFESLAVFF